MQVWVCGCTCVHARTRRTAGCGPRLDVARRLFTGLDGAGHGSNESFDQILTQILNSYQPAAQPAARDVVGRLPRRRVRGGDDERGRTQRVDGAAAAAAAVGAKGGDSRMEEGKEGAVADGPGGAKAVGVAAAGGTPEGEEEEEEAPGVLVGGVAAGKGVAAEPGAAKRQGVVAEQWARCRAGEPCSVCLSPFCAGETVVELPCGHNFHEDCILPWLREVRAHMCVRELVCVHVCMSVHVCVLHFLRCAWCPFACVCMRMGAVFPCYGLCTLSRWQTRTWTFDLGMQTHDKHAHGRQQHHEGSACSKRTPADAQLIRISQHGPHDTHTESM